jgi:gas vesicle protein
MNEDRSCVVSSLLLFLAGAAVGAAVVALTTPKTGPELRADLKGVGEKIRERIGRERCGVQASDETTV